jgi:serine phosphatase RsbU (regulator of sigma subunit)
MSVASYTADKAGLRESFRQKTLLDSLFFARSFLVVGISLVLSFHYWDELVDASVAGTALILRGSVCIYGLFVLALSFWKGFLRIHNVMIFSVAIAIPSTIAVIICLQKNGIEAGIGPVTLVLFYTFLLGAHTGLRAHWMFAASIYQVIVYDICAHYFAHNGIVIMANNICLISLWVIGHYFYFSITQKSFQTYVLSLELNHKNVELQGALSTINADLETARKLQRAILPQFFPTNNTITGTAIMDAAKQIGGDFYDFFEISEHKYCVVIADVSGKGVPAALFMAISRTVLRWQAISEGGAPGNTISSTNNQLCHLNPLDLFVTVFFGIVDTSNGVFCYSCAGHPPPFIIRHETGTITRLKTNDDIALGLFEQMPFAEETVYLTPGDSIILFTDGLSEAMNDKSEQYTEERMQQILEGVADRDVEAQLAALMSGIRQFVGSAMQSDDLTCLIFRYNGKGSDTPISGSKSTHQPQHADDEDKVDA